MLGIKSKYGPVTTAVGMFTLCFGLFTTFMLLVLYLIDADEAHQKIAWQLLITGISFLPIAFVLMHIEDRRRRLARNGA